MTDERHQTGCPSDALASQRAELQGELIGAQTTLQRVLAELASSGVSTASIVNEIQRLGGLQTSIATANAVTVQDLGREIMAAVARSQTVAQEARGQIAAAEAAGLSETLTSAAAASRLALQGAMDSLSNVTLKFTSPEDEAGYRRREDERRAYITAQQAKGTPEGDLNAAGAGVGQMVDAKAHGASGAEFQQRLDALMETTEKLREAAKANGVPREEFDRHLREDLRRIMKSKGLSDVEINARFAANPDPLDAAKAYLNSDDDLAQVRQSATDISTEVANAPNVISSTNPVPSHPGLNEAMAKLSAIRLPVADHSAADEFSHGVAQGQGNSTVRMV